jgi:predicted HTH transcriptional regulator
MEKVKEKYPNALEQQFIPKNEEFWKLDAFELFLKKRRKKIADEINNFMNSLIENELIKMDIKELIKKDEDVNLEFKSTFIWSTEENKIDKELKFNVLKTVVGFMNSNGGTLIIGVDDKHQVIGMELDYKSNWKGNKDGFILDFREYLESYIGINNYNRYIDLSFELVGDKEVCIVKVEKSDDFVYLKKDNKKVLYVRLGNRTKPLDDPEEIIEYIEEDKK